MKHTNYWEPHYVINYHQKNTNAFYNIPSLISHFASILVKNLLKLFGSMPNILFLTDIVAI